MRVYKDRKAKGVVRENSMLFPPIGLKAGHALANLAYATDTKLQASLRLLSASAGGLRLPFFQTYRVGKLAE